MQDKDFKSKFPGHLLSKSISNNLAGITASLVAKHHDTQLYRTASGLTPSFRGKLLHHFNPILMLVHKD